MSGRYNKTKMNSGVHIAMSAQLDNIDRTCHDVDICLRELQLPDLSFDIQLGVREALTNAVKHGSQNDPSKQIIFQINKQENKVVIMVKDEGCGFVPFGTKPPKEGPLLCCGRGLNIMHHYFDKVTFNERGNEVVLVKGI
nr:ATP-binding protein [Desulfobulbaceae bacterium]